MLLAKYRPKIIYQHDDSEETGFMISCARKNVTIAKLLFKHYKKGSN